MDLKSKTPIETLPPSSSSSSPSQFAFAITRTAVSQICQDIGYVGSKVSALRTLTHIATVYLQSLAKIAATHATEANRTDSNLFDVILALEDLTPVQQGFRGASSGVPKKSLLSCSTTGKDDKTQLKEYVLALEGLFSVPGVRDKSLLSSPTLVDIMKFVDGTRELPFAKPIPRFNPSRRRRNLPRKSKNRDYLQQIKHIPRWLPPFPDPSTYEIRRDIRFSKSIDDIDNPSRRLDSLQKSELAGGLLPEKRGRVRFKMGLEREGLSKMGVKLRNGVCRGGKRICLEQARDVFFGVENVARQV